MPETTREVILAAVNSFPAMSATATKVLAVLGDPNSDASDVEEVVRFDPGLTANILKLANSAYFGFPGRVGSVRQAVANLGWRRMYQLVIASAVNALMEKPVPGYDLPQGELWRQAIAGAVTGKTICDRARIEESEEAFTAALLRDIGKLVIGDYIDSNYDQIEAALEKGATFETAELDVLGTDHSEVGAWILNNWSLPERLVRAVRWHGRPGALEEPERLVDVVHLADALALNVCNGLDIASMPAHPDPKAQERLAFDRETLQQIVATSQEHYTSLGESLGP
jgi:HD-like signal output (HDOD) protein